MSVSDQGRLRIDLLDDFENSGLGWFWATDDQGRLIYISQKAADQLGGATDELLGQQLTKLFVLDPDEGAETTERPLRFLLNTRSSITDVTVRLATDENEIWWQITGHPLVNPSGDFAGYRGSAKDVTVAYRRQREASLLAEFDSLTGLSNRHRMSKRLASSLAAYKSTKRSCALLMLDLDRFKHVNDTLGHPAGDELLKQVAERLKRVLGSNGEIGRLGGDEFQIILPDIHDRTVLGNLADQIILMISQPYSISGKRAIIGASVGIAIAPQDGIETDELTKTADLALYAAKEAGRGQHRFYSNRLKDSADERRAIEADLRDALAGRELALHYQPIVRATDNQVAGFEALMRWEHPERGPVDPAVFIPIAEDSDLIHQLGEWALRRACEDAAGWPGDLKVAVNISAVQFFAVDLPNTIADALAAFGLAGDRLELQITESVFIGDAAAIDRILNALRRLGVRLVLDDFGTGYSSLGYLRGAPFHKLKIDQSFVRGSTEARSPAPAIMAATVDLATAFGMETTADGVETSDELAVVRECGATYVQGSVYATPMVNEAVLKKLNDQGLCFDPVGPRRQRAERRTVFRRVGVVHEGRACQAVMRNISRTGALIEGLTGIPVGAELLLDLGGGRPVKATVRRSEEAKQGVEFETPLVESSLGRLVAHNRASANTHALADSERPRRAGAQAAGGGRDSTAPPSRFMQVDV